METKLVALYIEREERREERGTKGITRYTTTHKQHSCTTATPATLAWLLLTTMPELLQKCLTRLCVFDLGLCPVARERNGCVFSWSWSETERGGERETNKAEKERRLAYA